MAKNINTNIQSGVLKFTFSDSDGDVIASFRMNPTDVRLAARCEELSDFFRAEGEKAGTAATVEDMVRYNAMLEEKICYLLGYDARQELFGFLSATTIFPDGDIFAVKIVDKVLEAIGPEIRKRKQAMQKASEKYTAKYKK